MTNQQALAKQHALEWLDSVIPNAKQWWGMGSADVNSLKEIRRFIGGLPDEPPRDPKGSFVDRPAENPQWTPEQIAEFRARQAQNICQGCFRPVSACVCSQMNRGEKP
jgi:hypothetical protein